jgi:uncharacterized membrane protein YcjF (UPF0283 family)
MTGLAGSLVVAIVIITYCIYLVQDFFDILKYEMRASQKQEASSTNEKPGGKAAGPSSMQEGEEIRQQMKY